MRFCAPTSSRICLPPCMSSILISSSEKSYLQSTKNPFAIGTFFFAHSLISPEYLSENSDEEKTGAILTAPSPSLSLIISLILSSVFSDTRRGKRTLMYSLLSADSALISII